MNLYTKQKIAPEDAADSDEGMRRVQSADSRRSLNLSVTITCIQSTHCFLISDSLAEDFVLSEVAAE